MENPSKKPAHEKGHNKFTRLASHRAGGMRRWLFAQGDWIDFVLGLLAG